MAACQQAALLVSVHLFCCLQGWLLQAHLLNTPCVCTLQAHLLTRAEALLVSVHVIVSQSSFFFFGYKGGNIYWLAILWL
jgi:hypothetical protein